VHATLFVKGAQQFNEELASFVGRLATEGWLASRYGAASIELSRRTERAKDRVSFTAWLMETAKQLATLYSQPGLSREAMLAQKDAIIAARAREYKAQAPSIFTNTAYVEFDMGSINNAYLDLYRLYEEDLSLYQRWYDEVALGSLPLFMESLTNLARSEKQNIKAAMAVRLSQPVTPTP
ncbi:MAG TPA: aminopeptidase, partial [Spirochaetales bacterium]|nr:aminopeptidase [Spirochaetales bacterium]